MRAFEFFISLTLIIHILWPLITGRENPRYVNLLPLLAIILIVIHLIYEGFRWQMIPVYTFTGIFLITALPELPHPSTKNFERVSWSAVGLIGIFLILASSVLLLVLMPIPKLPIPTGKYSVGTQTFVLIDESRLGVFIDKEVPRKFIIRVWYPANPGSNEHYATYIDHASVYLPAIANSLGLPRFSFNHINLLNSRAWQDGVAEPSNNGYPVILFSHGWNGYASQNSEQAMELASRGNIIVAIQHTNSAVVTVFPDGEIIYNTPSLLPNDTSGIEYKEASQKLVDQFSNDISFTLDFLSDKNLEPTNSIFSILDLSRVGVYGHGLGGTAVIQFCSTDTRCKAILAMDPIMTTISEQIINKGLSQSSFFIFSQERFDEKESKNNYLFKQFYENTGKNSHVIKIQGTTHNDFGDLPIIFPFAHQLGLTGSINGERMNKIINTYTSIFFIQALNDYSSDLITEISSFPEVINLEYLREIIHPVRLTLPGGQEFSLGKGEVRNGKWVPLRAEWLAGTEISRWVALPWSPELDTIIKTLKVGGKIELTMTNSDNILFDIKTIQKMNWGEFISSKSTEVNLQIVIFDNNDVDDTYWVITALPNEVNH